VIEINLLPGSSKRTARRMPKVGLPKGVARRSGTPGFDRWTAVAVAAWIAGPLLVGWLFLSTGRRAADLETGIAAARADSVRYAEMRRANEVLLARQDTIAQKLQIIQEIDASRFIWAHIMDEISRALPQYTWLANVLFITSDRPLQEPRFSIEGRTGNTLALTQFMQNLEASPFLRAITLVTTNQIREQDKLIYSFFLEGRYEEPPPEAITTVPLFGPAEGF
jgi:Tfp pilus assembly protein PilN